MPAKSQIEEVPGWRIGPWFPKKTGNQRPILHPCQRYRFARPQANPFPSSKVLVARFFEQTRYGGGFFIQASLEKQGGSWCSHPGFGVALEIAGKIHAKTNPIVPDPPFGFSRPRRVSWRKNPLKEVVDCIPPLIPPRGGGVPYKLQILRLCLTISERRLYFFKLKCFTWNTFLLYFTWRHYIIMVKRKSMVTY